MSVAKDRLPYDAGVPCRPATIAAFLLATSSEFSPAAITPEPRKTPACLPPARRRERRAACLDADPNYLAASPLFSALTRPHKYSLCTASSPLLSTLTQASAVTCLFSAHTKVPRGWGTLSILSYLFSITCKNSPAHGCSAGLDDSQNFAAVQRKKCGEPADKPGIKPPRRLQAGTYRLIAIPRACARAFATS